jgi:outer membrane protein assembly factor BamB
MRKISITVLCIALASITIRAGQRAAAPARNTSQLVDWLTDGGDSERTGWAKNEKILTKDNVGNLKLQWKLETENGPRALHSLMPAIVIGQLVTASGPTEVGIVAGISDNLYAFDAKTGIMIWQRNWTYPGQVPPNSDSRHLGFLRPGGSSDTPVVGPADSQGRRRVYFVTGDGLLHTLNAPDGKDVEEPYMFHTGKGWSLNLVGNILWLSNTYAGISVAAVKLDDPNHKVMTFNAASGGSWGRRGVAVDSTGTAWFTTGDGVYDLTTDPPRYGNSIVGVHVVGDELKLKDYFTPSNWEWLRKRDLDPNNTPTIFNFHGRELMAASGKECRMYLLDPRSAGGPNHQTPMHRTPLFCNEEVDFQDAGSWGALSTWEDSGGTRWVLAPFWGPAHPDTKFPIVNTPLTKEGGVAAFKVEDKGGKLQLTPAWVSRDMHRGEPVVIVSGMVFGYGSGEETKQAWPDAGLQFDSTIRAAKGTHATIFVLDAQTGKELWSSGDQIHQWNHFSGISVVNGRVYLGTYDGTIYCFGVADAKAN